MKRRGQGGAIPKVKLPKRLEKDIELEILLWLNRQPGCFAWKNKSMGTFNAKRGVYLRSHHRFNEKGTSDILGIYRGYMLCIEVKSATGRLQPHQAQFLEKMHDMGAIAFMARSLDDVKGQLLQNLVERIESRF
jgi:penicillin-binding protein-related factor A (putative recombinase)